MGTGSDILISADKVWYEFPEVPGDHFPDTHRRDEAIRDVSIDIPKGSFVVVFGHTGAGKTVLLHLLTGAITPTTGTVTIDGQDRVDQGDVVWAPAQVNYDYTGQNKLIRLAMLGVEWQLKQLMTNSFSLPLIIASDEPNDKVFEQLQALWLQSFNHTIIVATHKEEHLKHATLILEMNKGFMNIKELQPAQIKMQMINAAKRRTRAV